MRSLFLFVWLFTGGVQAVQADEVPVGPAATPARSDQFIIGMGQGDLSKGRVICQRMAELAARADIAKQVRVLVKEHISDRVRERTGRDTEQDIEIVRQEEVNELLRDVRIVDRTVDVAAGTCSSTAVIPKSRLGERAE